MKTLIVDDSTLFRQFVRNALSEISGVEVVGNAANGAIALEKIKMLSPDLVILDIHMPEVDGIGVLEQLSNHENPPTVIVLSARSESSIAQTTAALVLGAFDFIIKPTKGSLGDSHIAIREALRPRIEALLNSRSLQREKAQEADTSDSEDLSDDLPHEDNNPLAGIIQYPPEVVAIGVSTGGPEALMKFLPQLPADLPVPVLIVQHMPKTFTEMLAGDLDRVCPLHVCEGKDGDAIVPGEIFIAPGGQHMKVEDTPNGKVLRVDNSPPEKNCRPSVNYLLRSVASTYGGASLVAILTGMGNDGTTGCRLIRRKGGTVLTQDADSCVVYGMPRSVVEAGFSSEVCALENIAERILNSLQVEGQL